MAATFEVKIVKMFEDKQVQPTLANKLLAKQPLNSLLSPMFSDIKWICRSGYMLKL